MVGGPVTPVTKLGKGGHSRFRRESVEVKQRILKQVGNDKDGPAFAETSAGEIVTVVTHICLN